MKNDVDFEYDLLNFFFMSVPIFVVFRNKLAPLKIGTPNIISSQTTLLVMTMIAIFKLGYALLHSPLPEGFGMSN